MNTAAMEKVAAMAGPSQLDETVAAGKEALKNQILDPASVSARDR